MIDDVEGEITGRSPRLYQRASGMLAAEIRSGKWSVDSLFTETAVARRFGISRAPARQALAELEAVGLVRKSSGRGYVIAEAAGVASSDRITAEEGEHSPGDTRLHFLASWQLIYQKVEMDIVSRTAIASWRISEAALAKSFDVSRTVAREVIARLQQRGILGKDEAGRWYAPALTAKHITQLYELRWVLEPLALEKAYPRLPANVLPELRQALAQAIDAGERAGGEMLDAIEQQLHVQLLGYCDNAPLMQALGLPQAILVAHHRLYQPSAPPIDEEPFLLEHLEVLERLSGGDVAGACHALANHLMISRERAMMRIKTTASNLSLPELGYLERLQDVENGRQ
jgi:DNA-binding GntR family transcriptional regulator